MTTNPANPELEIALQGARSWVKSPLKDTRADVIGLVVDTCIDNGQVKLLALFPAEETPRLVSLEWSPDGEYTSTTDARARYRRLSTYEMEQLQASRSTGR